MIVNLSKKILFEKTSKDKNIEKFNNYFDCYLKLTDINPQFAKQYMQFDNQHVSNGKCKDAKLHVTVETCPLDDDGIALKTCKQNVKLTSSKGNPLTFPFDITPLNVSNYFGINTSNISNTPTTELTSSITSAPSITSITSVPSTKSTFIIPSAPSTPSAHLV
jgi:hypothetical protein